MDNIDQSNKRHGVAKVGRKAREDSKIKVDPKDKVSRFDSRGQELIKTKSKIDRVNKKAFAIQNVAKAKKRVATVVDRRTTRHTFQTVSDGSLKSPHFIALVGPTGCGKSTLLRTMMRHYTGQRQHVVGPVTVVCSKKKRVTFFECPNELSAIIDISKVADTILIMINVKQGLQNETLEMIECLNAHGMTRVMAVFTHIDEYPRHDKKALERIKLITKRLQTELIVKTYNLTELKKMRDDANSEYKLEEVVNLARLIGQKNPLPNVWRENHPYIVVDRIERNNTLTNDKEESLRFYGFLRGCKMMKDNVHMHLMGVGDSKVTEVTVHSDPCPTPQQESATKIKRHPLALKERKAYAPMCGYGGVLKDAEGFHVEVRQKDLDGSDDELNEKRAPRKSGLIRDLSDEEEDDDEEDEEEGGPPAKKQMIDSELVEEFDQLEGEMNIDNNLINYERLVYDNDYVCHAAVTTKDKELSKDLFVSGKWGDNEDASTLLRKDDLNKKLHNRDDGSDIDDDEEDLDGDEMDDENEQDDDEDEEEDEEEYDEEEEDEEEYEEEEEDCEDEEKMEVDEQEDEDSDEDNNSDGHDDLTNEWTSDTANLTDFQKKRLENASKTKRQKRLEKKEKKKALFDTEFDKKTGGDSSTAFFDKWKEEHNEQEQKNRDAFKHIEAESVHKFAGIEPGTYISVDINNVPKSFYANFSAKRAVILGGMAAGEETSAMLSGNFRIHRHFKQASVIKNYDPLCFSIGWRRIQSYCHFFKEQDNLRKAYLKYSATQGLFCNVAFQAPVVPVKTGFVAYFDMEPNSKYRVVALGSIHAKNDSIDIMKKLKRVGEPVKIFRKTAYIKNMFVDDLEVESHYDTLIKSVSGIRGAVKKAVSDKSFPPGTFRATFEAPLQLSDMVKVTVFVKAPIIGLWQMIDDLTEKYDYWVTWNKFKAAKGIALTAQNEDSKYKKIERPLFNPGPIELSKKLIDKLPFESRPQEPSLEDLVQKSRPKIVLDIKESQCAQLMDNIGQTEEGLKQKKMKQRQEYKLKLKAVDLASQSKKEKKSKERRKIFFQKNSGKPGYGDGKSGKGKKSSGKKSKSSD